MDIDKLFKVPKLPAGSNKRKLPDNPTPEMLKKMRFDSLSESHESSTPLNQSDAQPSVVPRMSAGLSKRKKLNEPSHESGPSRRATVQDEDEDADGIDSDFAPGGDADYFAEEDGEGRFFGGGLTSEQKEILNIFDNAEGEGAQEDLEEMSAAGVRRLLLRFERAANKNQDQRSKYPDDPSKFIDSEADLDSAIKALLPLAQFPIISYPELIRSESITLLIGLLSHENADIVIDVVEVIHELTDEDVGNEGEQDEEEQEEAQAALKTLIEAFLANSILELLVDNLTRLNEAEESDRQGVFHILGVFENILGFNPDLSAQLVAKTKIMDWLLNRIQSKVHDENRGYAAEILSILLQNNAHIRFELGKKDGVEAILKVLSQYRRRDPVDADETEFMENVFDILCSALVEPQIKSLFLASEGVDLMVLMMKEKLQSKSRSIKTLNYAMSGVTGADVCQNFVDALGLKTLFAAFMGKASKKKKSSTNIPASEETSHILEIIASLLSNLPSDPPNRIQLLAKFLKENDWKAPDFVQSLFDFLRDNYERATSRIRLLAKFVENNYEKVDKLLEVRDNAVGRLKVVDAEIEQEKKRLISEGEEIGPEEEDLWYLRRLDEGLFTLQIVDYIIAWICLEDDGIRDHVVRMLQRKDQTLAHLVQMLQMYHDNIDEQPSADASDKGSTQPSSRKNIIQTLMGFLNNCSPPEITSNGGSGDGATQSVVEKGVLLEQPVEESSTFVLSH